jgi:hypothetical protein
MRAFRAAVLVLACLVPFLATPTASASPTWTAAERLGGQSERVDITVNAAGDAVAVWATPHHVKAAYRRAGHNWGAAEEVGAGQWGGGVVLDGRGRATVLWLDSDYHLRLSDRTATGRWRVDRSDRVTDRRGASCGDTSQEWPAMTNDPAGDIVFSWTSTACEGYELWNSFVWRFADRSWGTVRDLGNGRPTVRFTTDGVATFVSSGSALSAVTSTNGGPPSGRQTLAETGGHGYFMASDMAVNARGDVIVAALQPLDPDTGTERFVTVTKPFDGQWQAPDVSGTVTGAHAPRVAINDEGLTAMTYVTAATDYAITVRVGNVSDGSWGAPTLVSGPESSETWSDAAVGPDGSVAVVWTTFRQHRILRTQAAYRTSDGSWGGPVTLAGAQTSGPAYLWTSANVVAYPNGMFTAVFDRNATLFSDHVDDDVAPTTRMVAPRRDYTTSTRVAVRWRATDQLARVRDADVRVRSAGRTGGFSAWSVWKRRTTDSSAVLTAKPGRTYCFAARARDRVGNRGSWSDERCTTTPLDDRALKAGPGWRRVTDRSAFLHTVTTGERTGAMLRLGHARGRTFRLLAHTCPGCGRVRVLQGGQPLGVVDLRSDRARARNAVLVTDFDHVHRGTVVIRIISHHKPVWIDGLLVG